MNWSKTEPVRLWLYGIAAPLAAIGVGYGVLSDAQASMWITLAGAVLGVVFGGEAARSKTYAPANVAQVHPRRSRRDHRLPGSGSVG